MSIFAKCNLYMYIHMYTYILKNIYVFHNIQMFKSYVCIHNTYVHKWDWKWSATSLASLPMVSCLARAWKWNFPPDIMIDRPTNQPTKPQSRDKTGHTEFSLPIIFGMKLLRSKMRISLIFVIHLLFLMTKTWFKLGI